MTEADGESLVEFREENGFAGIDAFMDHPVLAGKQNMTQAKGLLGESSDYFLLSAQLDLAQRNMRLYSVLHREDRQIKALARAGGSL